MLASRTPLGRALLAGPFLIVALYTAMLFAPATREAALTAADENEPIELLTFLFLMAGGALGTWTAWLVVRRDGDRFAAGFFAVFSLGLLVTGMEEVAWGQWFLKFETPAAMRGINAQGETTLHNIRGMQGNTEWFRLAFGLGGLIGVALRKRPRFRAIAPHPSLVPWLICIAGLAAVDLYDDFVAVHWRLDRLNGDLAELVEMMIGIAGLLYVGRKWCERSASATGAAR